MSGKMFYFGMCSFVGALNESFLWSWLVTLSEMLALSKALNTMWGNFVETASISNSESGIREEYDNIRKVTISLTPEIGSSDFDAFWTVVVTCDGISMGDTFHSIPRWPLCDRLRNKII